ncbi:Bacterial cell division membrane protein [Richelia intracellularis HH01]|jgi:rod shape determining protein RodA|uniref:Peptidoglycan glycosyltransferase RodA n=1 Tax=Richelia intracellularis HH01 TaxID=1165094 RepID=M1X300_9NOST|nr:rod shape-determining protein RodA [Richelia intracellularis]CCH67710.1 Bacterial cell division membrane protein [Richelia intracellularis HH01]
MLQKKSRSSPPNFILQYIFKPWQQMDLPLLFLTVAVTIFGGIMIRSTQPNKVVDDCLWHWITGGVGIFFAVILARVPYQNWFKFHWLIYTITNLSLIAVLVTGMSVKGAQRWINIFGFYFQPSEFAKIGIILTIAALLQKHTANKLKHVFKVLAFTGLPWLLVFRQPDLATSLVFGAIVLGMLYWANANPCWLLLLISPIIAAILDNLFKPGWIIWSIFMGVLAWLYLPWQRFGISALGGISLNLFGGELGAFAWNNILKPYQKTRLTVFLNPEQDTLASGYHQVQSKIAIGSGQLWGWGLNQGPMTQLGFVPEQHTDFIFSAVGEQLGFIGCVITISIFCLICLRILHIAQTASDNCGSLLAAGVLSMILFQTVVNIGMTIGLVPVAGIPLPWMTYGRSAMLTNFIGIGLVESVANFRNQCKYY